MAEYWKSTPKYWCKFCKIFVRDTKFDRQQHEATGKHQGSIQRNLRDLHKEHEKEQREKQRAKDEVARLNGIVSSSTSSKATSGSSSKSNAVANPQPVQATPEERKRQLGQLAAMGIAIPEEYRREMAMVGDWEVVSETPIGSQGVKKQEDEDVKPALQNIGVHKRKLGGDEEEEDVAITEKRKMWGRSFKSYPHSKGEEDDLDALLDIGRTPSSTEKNTKPVPELELAESSSILKTEPVEEDIGIKAPRLMPTDDMVDATEAKGAPSEGIVFKKRKKARQK
ncbi:hypothetical protein M501DRAFT_1008393 [Patellaria atrata CBS 101060]|uniref:U1-C C2H2-type zinc finger domain-containing protein n=1 Tax=Patellaria atrata CBS 101060 TaxID=1346257 RepID=A0A9P4SHQ6_9PEZI|nr:hypothetical protein M501DRAFT_1008393 [Patellaria atrata CBS 101060]